MSRMPLASQPNEGDRNLQRRPQEPNLDWQKDCLPEPQIEATKAT
jgi:hypothetical protein